MKAAYACALLVLMLAPAAHAATVETFVSPDCSFSALSAFIAQANESLLLSTYTFTSPEIAELLLSRSAEGVDVRVMADKSPAGGIPKDERALMCALNLGGIDAMLYDGEAPFMHAKYVVRDGDAVLVASENIGPEGFHPDAEYGNRGWGAVLYDPAVAAQFSEAFAADFAVSAALSCGPEDYDATSSKNMGAYAPRYRARTHEGQEVTAVFSPDSLEEMLSLIESANQTIDVEQLYIYAHWGSPSRDTVQSAPSPLIEALAAKAREGVKVRILMDSVYYNVEKTGSTSNYHTAKLVSCMADEEGLPIEAGLIDLDGKGLRSLHNKGVIVDAKTVLVSSINWNENSVMNNREAGVIIEGNAASFYQSVFNDDWQLALKVACDGAQARVAQSPLPGTGGDAGSLFMAIAAVAVIAIVLIAVIYFVFIAP